MEEKGPTFTTKDVAWAWLNMFPYGKLYTAERAAYRNLIYGADPAEAATYRNPFREWIGAQIRADAFGYASSGMPDVAAELAFRDAALSHVANVIYGELWVAVMLAGAFVLSDPEEIIRTGLREITRTSRLTEAIERRFSGVVRNPIGRRS